MKRAALILFVTIIINVNSVYGQNAFKVEGIVVDENNKTLPYVSINMGTYSSTMSNSEGNFL